MKIRKIKKKSKILVRAKLIAEQVDLNKEEYSKLSIEDLKIRTDYLIEGLKKNKFSLDDIVVDAFSIAREIIFREHGLFAFPVQIMGAFVVHSGDFAEMYTGEGKTLTILLVSFLNALAKKGVHIVTVNEYLVERDAEFARKAFEKIGITVGYNISKLSKEAKKEMFARDITYTTNSELGFDYLRDNMVRTIEEKVIRDLFFVIVDEGDSVLIDEARTPLIISGQPKEDFSLYLDVDKFVKSIEKDDYVIDSESNTIALSETGVSKAEKFFNLSNLYSVESAEVVHKITNGLISNYIFSNGREYLVKDDKIYLIDQFTGRILEGRSYNAGLQQAIQAKERVKIEPENVVMATITYQSFFRLYERLSAVSGTAMTEAEEFLKIYNMVVVKVPTNRPIKRIDQLDYVFGTKKVKWNHVVEEISNRHKKGQPILVGTASVTDSEIIHERLLQLNIPHEVLNARDNSREAEIVKHAGELGAVTISTNMAGRGTDIKITEEVRELGGLYVLGTERHESRRIDNQLRGRTGRQGDPGESRFFISLEDSLFKRYASERIGKASEKLEEDYYNSSFFTKMLNSTQKKVEGLNFDIRKNLMDYDHVLSLQRELIYKQRDQILLKTNSLKIITNMAKDYSEIIALSNINKENSAIIDTDAILNFVHENILKFDFFHINDFDGLTISLASEKLFEIIKNVIEAKYKILEEINALDALSELLLVNLDQKWTTHIDKMIKLREGVHLRSLEQRSPLNIYIEDGNNLFEKMKNDIVRDVILGACKLSLPNEQEKIRDALSALVNSKGFKKKINNDFQEQSQLLPTEELNQENYDNPLEIQDDTDLSDNQISTNQEILEEPVNYDAQKELIEETLTPHVLAEDEIKNNLQQDVVYEQNTEDNLEQLNKSFQENLEQSQQESQPLQDVNESLQHIENEVNQDKDFYFEKETIIKEKPLLLGDYINSMIRKYANNSENSYFSNSQNNLEKNSSDEIVVLNNDSNDVNKQENEQVINVDDNIDQKIANDQEEFLNVVNKIFKPSNEVSSQKNQSNYKKSSLDFYKLPNVSPKPIGKLFESKNKTNKFNNFNQENNEFEKIQENLTIKNDSLVNNDNLLSKEEFEKTIFVDDEKERLDKINKLQEDKLNSNEKDLINIDFDSEISVPSQSDDKKSDLDSDQRKNSFLDDSPISAAYFINENFSFPDIGKIEKKDISDSNFKKDEVDKNLSEQDILSKIQFKPKMNEFEIEVINEMKKDLNFTNKKKSSFNEQIINLIWNKHKDK